MLNIESHLRDLLYQYDCVTIPGLGGFVMHTRPARIDRGRSRLSPPSRVPSFNSLLDHDDGLLASSVARGENISYQEASSRVAVFAAECKAGFQTGKTFAFEGIGELSVTPEGRILFTPLPASNLNAAAYGLEAVLLPMPTAQKETRQARKPIDRKIRTTGPKPASVKWTLAVTLPLILFLLYGIIFPVSVRPVVADLSEAVRQVPGIFFSNHEVVAPSVTIPSETIIPAADPMKDIQPLQEEVMTVAEPEIITDLQPLPEPVPSAGPRYYIIGGCFEDPGNARKFHEELSNRGYDAEEAGANKLGHIRISYKSFTEKPPALLFLEQIRQGENPSAWLLKY